MKIMDVEEIEKELEKLDDVVSKEVDFTMIVLCAKTIILMYKFLVTWYKEWLEDVRYNREKG